VSVGVKWTPLNYLELCHTHVAFNEIMCCHCYRNVGNTLHLRYVSLEKLWLDDNKLTDLSTFAILAGLRRWSFVFTVNRACVLYSCTAYKMCYVIIYIGTFLNQVHAWSKLTAFELFVKLCIMCVVTSQTIGW